MTRKIVTSESDRSMGLILFHSRTTQLEKMVPVRYTTMLVLEMMELQGPGLLTPPSVAMVDVVMMIQLGLVGDAFPERLPVTRGHMAGVGGVCAPSCALGGSFCHGMPTLCWCVLTFVASNKCTIFCANVRKFRY